MSFKLTVMFLQLLVVLITISMAFTALLNVLLRTSMAFIALLNVLVGTFVTLTETLLISLNNKAWFTYK